MLEGQCLLDLRQVCHGRRVRRRRQAAPRRPQASPQPHGRDAEVVRAYEETFTAVLMQTGMLKMMSRVLVCLYTTDAGSLTAAELVQHLQVSPGSISKAIAFLEGQGLVRRQRDERYVTDDDVWYQAMIADARSTAHLAGTALQGAGVLGPGTPAAPRSRHATSCTRNPKPPRTRLGPEPTPEVGPFGRDRGGDGYRRGGGAWCRAWSPALPRPASSVTGLQRATTPPHPLRDMR